MQISLAEHLQIEPEDSHEKSKIEQKAENGNLTVYLLNLVVIRAYDLMNMDYFNLSDPYCEVDVGGVSMKTRAINNSLNPVWKERMHFLLPQEPDHITFTVKDATNETETIDLMGRCTFSLDGLFATEGSYHGKLTLVNEKEKRGEIRVRLSCKKFQTIKIEKENFRERRILTTRLLDVFAAAEKLEKKHMLSERIRKELEENNTLRDDILNELMAKDDSLNKKEQKIITLNEKLKETDRRESEAQKARAKIQLDLNDMKSENERLKILVENMKSRITEEDPINV